MKNEDIASTDQTGGWLRILRPLLWWLFLVLVLLGIHTHQRLLEKTRLKFIVTLQGQPLYGGCVMLDGQPAVNGQKISLGSHQFIITHPKGVTYATNLFIWYGGIDLGGIDLLRAAGTLSVTANPPADTIRITGPEFSLTLDDSSGTNVLVPTDAYQVEARYRHCQEKTASSVFAGQTTPVNFAPQFGALRLDCNQPDATYQLQTTAGQIVVAGVMPSLTTQLSAGDYALNIQHHGHQRMVAAKVRANATNAVNCDFQYGAAVIETSPAGASVISQNQNLGETPLTVFELLPGAQNFVLQKNGYQSVEVSLVVTANQTNVVSTNLVNFRYPALIQQVRQELLATHYDAAAQAADEILQLMPKDVDALALQAEVNHHLDAEHQRQQRLKRPRNYFDLVCRQNPDANLFAEHGFKTSKPAKELATAIAQSLAAKPGAFEITYNDATVPETYEIKARQTFSLGIIGGTERDCLLVLGQTKDDETEIYFRVLEYRIQHRIEGNSLFDLKDIKQMIPVSPGRIQMDDAMQSQLKNGVQLVTERIQSAIDSLP